MIVLTSIVHFQKGDPELRQAIADNFYEHGDIDDILVHVGAEEAIHNFMRSCLGPGDHLIVQWPSYQSSRSVAVPQGCEISDWNMKIVTDTQTHKLSWSLDIQELVHLIVPGKTRAIYLNSPHNPSGFQFSRDQFDAIVEIARQHDLYLFVDEVYR